MHASRASLVFLALFGAAASGLCGCAKSATKEKNADEFNADAFRGGSMAPTKTESSFKQVGAGYHEVSADVARGGEGFDVAQVAQSKVGGVKTAKKPQPAKTSVERKIIYTATIQVFVEDLDAAQKKLDALRKTHKAYVATANISGQTGSQRSGSWTIRLPVEQFDAFRKAILDFGYPQQNALSSEDITRQYYSLESRMRNAEATEKRLLAHLEKSQETKDTLAIEKELDRVRGTIEEMKGQLQVWQTLTALTTVNLTLIEKKNYQPPQEPTFVSRISDTFNGSVDGLAAFGRGVTLILVALIPWLPVLAVIVIPMWWAIRRSRRKALHKESL